MTEVPGNNSRPYGLCGRKQQLKKLSRTDWLHGNQSDRTYFPTARSSVTGRDLRYQPNPRSLKDELKQEQQEQNIKRQQQ